LAVWRPQPYSNGFYPCQLNKQLERL